MRKALTFDDIALVPKFNSLPPQPELTFETRLTRNTKMAIPLVAANMESVIGDRLADLLIANGSIPIFHRYTDFETQRKWAEKYKNRAFVSAGMLHTDDVRRLLDGGALGVCIDIAHGHAEKMLKMIAEVKRTHPTKEVIAGNVCTAQGYEDLVNAGADAVKVGIGPGAVCTTRMVTGFGVPQFSAIFECAVAAKKLNIPIIADGGIRGSRDLVLALAAGASSVMIGKLFAITEESAAPKRVRGKDGKVMEAKFRGPTSEDFQIDYYGGVRANTVPEGIDFWGRVSGSAQAVIDTLIAGLRSSFTYGGAKNIAELQQNAEFIEVSANYLIESQARDS